MSLRLPSLVHPSFDALEDFVAQHGERGAHRRLAGHVSSCLRCQTSIREMRELKRLAVRAPYPSMNDQLLDRIERATASGVRVILPAATPSSVARRDWGHRRLLGTGAAALAAGLLMILLISIRHDRLDAALTVGELTATPRSNVPTELHLRYHAAELLAGADSAYAHAIVFNARSLRPEPQMSYTLRRQHDGAFAADVSLPIDAVFARFTVASADGKHVDDNDARMWEFSMRDSSNRPLFDGLSVQHAIHGFDDWERSFSAAQDMLRFYPEKPAALRYVIAGTIALRGSAAADSVIQAFRPRVDALQQKYYSEPATATMIWEMEMLSAEIGDTTMARRWLERSVREYPRDPGTVQLRDFAIFSSPMSKEQRMHALDALWAETGGAAIQLAYDAFALAKELGDGATLARWGGRLAEYPGWDVTVAKAYVAVPALRSMGETMLRASLAQTDIASSTDWQTALRAPATDARARQRQQTFAALGEALLADHPGAAAVDTLRRAAAAAWDGGTLNMLGDAELAAGNRSAAAEAYAWVVADPRTARSRADSLRAQGVAIIEPQRFDALVNDGHQVLRALTASTMFRRSFPSSVQFADVRGDRRSIGDVAATGVSIVAFVSRSCAPSLSDLPALQQISDRMKSLGIPVIVLVEESPSADATAVFAQRGYRGPLFFDDRAEVARGMREIGTPTYFVVEGGRSIRAETHSAKDLLLSVDAVSVSAIR